MAGSFIRVPTVVVKQRMHTCQFTSAPNVVRTIAAKEGFKVLYAKKYFCSSNNKTNTVEDSLISAFTKTPFCLESPELQELGSKLTPQLVETVLKSLRNWRLAQLFFQWASNQRAYTHNCYVYNAIAEILSTARQNAPLRELAVTLTKTSCYWTPGAFGYFLRCLGSQGLVEEANSLFDHMKISALCALNGYSYNCLLEVIAKRGDVGLLEHRLNEMKELGWPIDKHALTPALQCYCNANHFDKAILVFNDLTKKGLVDQHIVAILVLSYSKCREVDMAFELIEWAERNLKISLNEKTLCILVHGFVREDRVDKALQLYDKMKKHGYFLDVSIYYVLIRGLCKNKAIEKALMLYKYMRVSGIPSDVQIIYQLLSCILDERDMIQLLEDALTDLDAGRRLSLFSSILKDLINGGYDDKAYCLLKAYTSSGMNENSQEGVISLTKVKLDSTCFEIVIGGLCNAGKLDMALDLSHSMDQCGCTCSVLLFNNLIQCLSNANKLNECFNLLNKMKETEIHPTHFTYNCILGSLCRQLDVVGAIDLLTEMRSCGHEPWIKNYTLLVKKLCEHGKADEGYSFLTDMSKEGFLPDMIAYSAIIDGFLNGNELDRGIELFREICGQGYCPDVVAHNTIIKGLCKAKRINEAEDILKEIFGKGLVPSVVTYNLLIDGWCKEGNADQAVLCFSMMIEQEVEPNIITYTTLVDGLCSSGKSEDALNLWIEMEHKGCLPNRISYMALIHGLCKCRQPDCAMVYLQEMEKKDMLPDPYVYQALVEAFSSESNLAMAHKVLDKMSKHGFPKVLMAPTAPLTLAVDEKSSASNR
ncbi:putative pentatricopeptide repeat-containing protein, mitochondrial [Salvia divinorum]|uniref:Pentatricopeptide repeat-containing protein, mitochondrial n=1 Tax=Salvia divinorum TaxID=28513 RepID=A0ABD1ILL3_SALDI